MKILNLVYDPIVSEVCQASGSIYPPVISEVFQITTFEESFYHQIIISFSFANLNRFNFKNHLKSFLLQVWTNLASKSIWSLSNQKFQMI